jgi:predicted HTH domain antitoxin
MSHIQLELPDDLIDRDMVRLAREALLVRLYALGRISSGRCAELLKVPRRQFLDLAGEYEVSVFAEPEDLGAEAARGIG